MPEYDAEPYRPPLGLRGAHIETVLPNVTRRRFRVDYNRERLELSDGDFVDLDLCPSLPQRREARSCVVALHGLEGSSAAPYVKSLARALRGSGLDLLAMNLRGCSGEVNRALRFYHAGETGDLGEVIEMMARRYDSVLLLGFSLGGNIALRFLGELGDAAPACVKAAVAVSAPIDLEGSAMKIGQDSNRFYMRRFIRLLSQKLAMKGDRLTGFPSPAACARMKDFAEFDGQLTAPLNGFRDARHYWSSCSALAVLGRIRRPSLLLSARNDPFLSEDCFASEQAERSEFLYACFPDRGGHLGFPSARRLGAAWHEQVALGFLKSWI